MKLCLRVPDGNCHREDCLPLALLCTAADTSNLQWLLQALLLWTMACLHGFLHHAARQEPSQGTFHLARDFAGLDEIDLGRKYDPLELINLLQYVRSVLTGLIWMNS